MSKLQTYNAMDAIATFQLYHVLSDKLAQHPYAAKSYQEAKEVSSPFLYAMLRGILVDKEEMEKLRLKFEAECKLLETSLDAITRPLLGGVINFASSPQVQWMFACLGAEIDSADREALEGLAKADPELSPLVNIILAWRNRAKMLTVLQPELVDRDGRMRCTYKVGGTVTFRIASSKNCLWTGMNLTNLKRDEDEEEVGHASIRSMFIADPGHKFFDVDLERADSWAVALEVYKATGDTKYLEACGATDLHTHVAKFVWPELGWTGDEEADIKIAKQFFYRQYDYRFMCKKLQHGSNYLGSAWALAAQMKIPLRLAVAGQEAYFREFPAIKKWHGIKAHELQTTGHLTNLLGNRRNFHGRLDNNSTLKEAIAYLGQSVTAKVINRAITNLWRVCLQMPDLGVQFLAQVHDSALCQFPEANELEARDTILQVMRVPITVTSPKGETITATIPLEGAAGWNWASMSRANRDGKRKLKPGQIDDRRRQRTPTKAPSRLMDRRLSGVHGRPK